MNTTNITTPQTQDKIDCLMERLEAAGKRATPQRYAVCQALVEHGGHPTATEVFEQVRSTFPMISQATIYNTIDTLEELGLIHRLDIANHDHTHYDLDVTPHINVVCRYCEYIADVEVTSLDNLLDQVSEQTGCKLDRQGGLIVYGICPTCQQALQAGKPLASTSPEEGCCPQGAKRKRRGRQYRHRTSMRHTNGQAVEEIA
jgi:Fe2+ or Zn2+ uptake regulation protein